MTLHPNGRWEARIGIPGQKHVYLGLFEKEGEVARAYDETLVRLRGLTAATNFAISNYKNAIKVFYEENSDETKSITPDNANATTTSTTTITTTTITATKKSNAKGNNAKKMRK